MATYHAIAATSQAIISLLSEAAGGSEFDGAAFKLIQASNFEKPQGECITLFLYRVAVNTNRRNLPPRRLPDGRHARPALPVDLHYVLTAWATDAQRQQQLLGWSMRVLEDTPILPSGLLNMPPEAGAFGATETVELVCDPISLQDMVNVWEALKPAQLSVAYVARMIAIESPGTLTEAEPVQTREFEFAKME